MQGPQLYKRINGEVQQVLQKLQLQQGGGGGAAALAGSAAGEGGVERGRASSFGLAFELPYVSKFLLLAAYIASRNKPASDRAVFDAGHSKRGRRNAQAHDRQVRRGGGTRGGVGGGLKKESRVAGTHVGWCASSQAVRASSPLGPAPLTACGRCAALQIGWCRRVPWLV